MLNLKRISSILLIAASLVQALPKPYLQEVQRRYPYLTIHNPPLTSKQSDQNQYQPLSKRSATAPLPVTDPNWDAPFLAQGPAGGAIFAGPLNGKTVVAGIFVGADDVRTPCVAEWDGSHWTSLGGGADHSLEGCDYVDNAASDGHRFYLTTLTYKMLPSPRVERTCNGPLSWDGAVWTCLAGNFDGDQFLSLAAWKGNVLFSTSTGCYRWDGKTWQAFPSIRGNVNLLRTGSNGLWLSGHFTIEGDSSIHNLALWDGTTLKGAGEAPDSLTDIVEWGGHVFAVKLEFHRSFYEGDSLSFHEYDGKNWSRLDVGQAWGPSGCLAAGADGVYLSARDSEGSKRGTLIRWDGSRYEKIPGSGFADKLNWISVQGDTLYLAGSFRNDSLGADNVLTWDKKGWHRMTNTAHPGPYAYPRFIRGNGPDLYVGGPDITYAGNKAASGIVHWNGKDWDAMAGGVSIEGGLGLNIQDMSFRGSDIYIGGRFDSAQGRPAKNVAHWDGRSWSALGKGFPGQLRALVCDRDGVVVGGSTSGADPGENPIIWGQVIGRWNGSSWETMGSGLTGEVDRLAYYHGKVCAFGNLKRPLDTTYSRICVWDGKDWTPVQSPLPEWSTVGYVEDATIYHDSLFFICQWVNATIDSVNHYGLYSWNGTAVTRIKAFPAAWSLAADDSNLYVQGSFEGPQDGKEVPTLLRYGDDGWHSLLTSRDYEIWAGLATTQDGLYVNAEINGGKPSYPLIHWNPKGNAGILARKSIGKGTVPGLQFLTGSRFHTGTGYYGVYERGIFSLIGRKAAVPASTTTPTAYPRNPD